MNSILMKGARLKALEFEVVRLCTWLISRYREKLDLEWPPCKKEKIYSLLMFKSLTEEQQGSIPQLSIFIKEENFKLLAKLRLYSFSKMPVLLWGDVGE
jgi:hypothetical protein